MKKNRTNSRATEVEKETSDLIAHYLQHIIQASPSILTKANLTFLCAHTMKKKQNENKNTLQVEHVNVRDGERDADAKGQSKKESERR